MNSTTPVVGRGAAKRYESAYAERPQIRDLERNALRDVAQCIAALITVRGRVGQRANPDAVEHDDDRSREGRTHVLLM